MKTLRPHRRGQRLRHVHLRHLRHALGQRRAEPGVRALTGQRLRGHPARLEPAARAGPARGRGDPRHRHHRRRHRRPVDGAFFQSGATVTFGGVPASSVSVDRSTRLARGHRRARGGAVDVGCATPTRRRARSRAASPTARARARRPSSRAPVRRDQCLRGRGQRPANAGQRLRVVARRGHDHRGPGHEPDHLRRRPSRERR